MRRLAIFVRSIPICLIFLLFSTGSAENTYPVVLVHGFMGWGPEEMGGYRYWGGFFDLQDYLEKQGYTVYTASVGPVSSNWERAVEAFYQLKGGQVDYGKNHSEKWGIVQRPEGKNYEGMYPEWDSEHPIHIIGHSMGGQTARMLNYLLANTFFTDESNPIEEESFLLGSSHKGWIKSITSISTPHNGTTLSDIRMEHMPFLRYVIGVAGLLGTDFYDFDLQQWRFEREEGESWGSYYRRMREHPAWDTENFSGWDLSLEGARELNTFLKADSGIYYFSLVTSCTVLDTASGYHVPDEDMNHFLRSKARLLGRQTVRLQDGSVTDSTWFENDGVVSTISQSAPTTGLNGPDPYTKYNPGEPLRPGQWYVLGPYRMDHWQIVGHFNRHDDEKRDVVELYEKHCGLLYSLPQ